MYGRNDIRSTLTSASEQKPEIDPALPIRSVELVEFNDPGGAREGKDEAASWIVRATNAVLSFSRMRAGEVLDRSEQPDEYAILMYSQSAPVRVRAGNEERDVSGEAFVVVPPGASTVEALADGVVIRLFSALAKDLCEVATNADSYLTRDPRVAPLGAPAQPVAGNQVRVYPLEDYPLSPDRFGRIFRTSNCMVNFVPEELGPRDSSNLSPHHHDDFEQLTLALKGKYVHHIRYPWGPDARQWKSDEKVYTTAPSVLVIPPPVIHTTQGLGDHQQHVDIFAPPRQDFLNAGWVVNSSDYY